MIITAKFASVCPACSHRIAEGSKVEWERGTKARHVSCPTAAVASSSAAVEPTRAAVTVERVGRRSYLRGDTYAVRGMLRDAGCHWDAASSAWWIGDDGKARELASKAATAPREAAPVKAFARHESRGRWNGCSCGARELPGGGLSANACRSCQFDEYDN